MRRRIETTIMRSQRLPESLDQKVQIDIKNRKTTWTKNLLRILSEYYNHNQSKGGE